MQLILKKWIELIDKLRHLEKSVNAAINWPREGGGGGCHSPLGFSSFSREWKELLFQTKFLAVGSCLRHLFMKNFFRSDLPS